MSSKFGKLLMILSFTAVIIGGLYALAVRSKPCYAEVDEGED